MCVDTGGLGWQTAGASRDTDVVRPVAEPFSATGGLKLLTGNMGRSVIKVSAVPEDRHVVQAPCRVFDSQEALQQAFKAGELARDVVCVVRWQGPQANGMPELLQSSRRHWRCCKGRATGWPGDRWSHERCVRQSARCHPRQPRGGSRPGRWPSCKTATWCAWTPRQAPGGPDGCRRLGRGLVQPCPSRCERPTVSAWAGSCLPTSAAMH